MHMGRIASVLGNNLFRRVPCSSIRIVVIFVLEKYVPSQYPLFLSRY
jgi:hypothetical protein